MTIRSMLAVAGIVVLVESLTGASPVLAGPCSKAIDRMQTHVDAALAAHAAAGPVGDEGNRALMHRQPTPDSIAAAEVNLGDISPEAMDTIVVGMERARQADAVGDAGACEQALGEVRRAIAPRAD
ncbi:hypothetical protein [Blastochloris viridis]|uniref:Uncharacterized protein n=1 Tax=Blastochloris viridis TaxID=1079 RepID=A0A0H5BNY7_BLAVI|nr:hypothetical protein [Blastochloris viridis]ALK08276.1 hypothetical protein BVIR_478 [Blastochloris viridis]BAR98458.1 hypothetical protein BV133_865 [Blastochloris viridis]CUU44198.1 hypothetical protein BVIRIDIS_32450 [Blastochloris viridis]